MRRREVISGLASMAAWPLAGLAQEVGKVRRIGFLRVGEPPAAFIDSFRRGLREVGRRRRPRLRHRIRPAPFLNSITSRVERTTSAASNGALRCRTAP